MYTARTSEFSANTQYHEGVTSIVGCTTSSHRRTVMPNRKSEAIIEVYPFFYSIITGSKLSYARLIPGRELVIKINNIKNSSVRIYMAGL